MSNEAYLGLRLPQTVLDQMDATAVRMERESPGQRVTRSDVARRCMLVGLPLVCGVQAAAPAPETAPAPDVARTDADVVLDPELETLFDRTVDTK